MAWEPTQNPKDRRPGRALPGDAEKRRTMNAQEFARRWGRVLNAERSYAWKRRALQQLQNQAGAELVTQNGRNVGYRLQSGGFMCLKRRYPTEASAQVALNDCWRAPQNHRHERRVYQCPLCDGWHLTSQ